MIWVLVLLLATAAGAIGGVVGFGSSIIVMPALVVALGAKAAVPVISIAGLMTNISRVSLWWRVVEWRAVLVFSATAIPMSAAGAYTLVALPTESVQIALALFFVALIPLRHLLRATGFRINLAGMALVGAGIGFLSGLVTIVGPVNTPFFLAYGLVKGPFIATEAATSAVMGLTKSSVFRHYGALPWDILAIGVMVGAASTAGTWVSTHLMAKLDAARFQRLMDAMLLVAAAVMLSGIPSVVELVNGSIDVADKGVHFASRAVAGLFEALAATQ